MPRTAPAGVPNRRARLAALGDAAVPQCAEHTGRILLALAAATQPEVRTP